MKLSDDRKKPRLAAIIALPVLLAALLALSFFAEKYVPEDYAEGVSVSVGAFAGGYDAVAAELAEKEVAEAADAASGAETSAETSASDTQELYFSLDNDANIYFFDSEQTLEIMSSLPADIYYTTDGTLPDSKTGKLYEGPLTLACGKNTRVYGFSAVAYFYDGTVSDVYCRTYFVGLNALTKYDTVVFSLITDPNGLYSRRSGILNDNNTWQHGREWERGINVECYSQDGSLLFTQNAGVRIFGAYSRSMSLKPMRLIARKDYDTQNRFIYDFFDNLYATDGTKIETFQQLVLRNAGNDFGTAFMRDEVVQTLMAQQGFTFTESVSPCLVYVNGELYGFYWIHEPYKDSYFEERYGGYDYQGSFVVLDGPERAKSGYQAKYDYLNPIADYRKMYMYYKKDLTDNAVYSELCALLDVDSYLQMQASMAYVDNGDWPQNNDRTFKYFAAEGEDFTDVYGLDGKWYFIPHDTDWSFFGEVSANTLERNYDKKQIQYSPLFVALMQRADCRRTYVTYFLDMMNGAFSPDNSAAAVQAMIDSIRNSVGIMHAESEYAPDDSDSASFERRAPRIIDYLAQRGAYISQYLTDKYELGDFYKLYLDFADGGAAYVNTLWVDKQFTGIYYENYTTVLTAVVPPGRAFDCWIVNDVPYETEELTLDASFVRYRKITVTLRLTDPENPALSICEVSSGGFADYITLINNTSQTVSTLGYALSDDAADPTKYLMPVMRVAPGETVTVYCKNYSSASVLKSMVADFGLKTGETLTLSHKDADSGVVSTLDSVTLPRLEVYGVYRCSLVTGEYFEVDPSDGGTGGLTYNRFAG